MRTRSLSKTVQTRCHRRMTGSQLRFANRYGTLIQRHGLRIVALQLIDLSKTVQRFGNVWMIRSTDFFCD